MKHKALPDLSQWSLGTSATMAQTSALCLSAGVCSPPSDPVLEQIPLGKQRQNRGWASFIPNSGIMRGKDKVGNNIKASVGWHGPWVPYKAPPYCHILGLAPIPQLRGVLLCYPRESTNAPSSPFLLRPREKNPFFPLQPKHGGPVLSSSRIDRSLVKVNESGNVHCIQKNPTFLLKIFFIYLRERWQRVSTHKLGEGRGRERISSRPPTESTALHGSQFHDLEIMTRTETKSCMLNQLSHPGAQIPPSLRMASLLFWGQAHQYLLVWKYFPQWGENVFTIRIWLTPGACNIHSQSALPGPLEVVRPAHSLCQLPDSDPHPVTMWIPSS